MYGRFYLQGYWPSFTKRTYDRNWAYGHFHTKLGIYQFGREQ
uniref:Uncharacterized protein n=1 Tax=Anguilla anguilla TaxID=7936 RepID=A0A0E9TPY2_ANGAN